MTDKYSLTSAELELMTILWNLGQGTVHDVIANLPNKRKLAYTSVSTILRILQQKKIVKTKKIGRQHIYRPILSKQAFASHTIKKFMKQVFSNNTVELVSHLVSQHAISSNEIDAIQHIIDAKKKEFV